MARRRKVGAGLAAAVAVAASVAGPATAFDLQGHRGARGLAPENTLPAFARALAIGVTTLETDLAVTSDGVLVLSHDPALNPDIVRGPDGAWLKAPGPAILNLTFAELSRFDIGRIDPRSKYAGQFPAQVPVDATRFPRLDDLFDLGERAGRRPRYNIETKISPLNPAETLAPEPFARAAVDAVRRRGLERRVTIQSFDWRTLLAVRRLAPEIETVCLTIDTARGGTLKAVDGRPSPWLGGLDPNDHGGSVALLAKVAGCAAWSPFWRNVTAAGVAEAKSLGLRVVPWTVNEPEEIVRLARLGVDGLISDYPDRARAALVPLGIAID